MGANESDRAPTRSACAAASGLENGSQEVGENGEDFHNYSILFGNWKARSLYAAIVLFMNVM